MFFLLFSWSAPTSALATRLRRRNPAAVTLIDCLAHQRHSPLHVRPIADAQHTSNGGAKGPRDRPVPSRNTSEEQATREQPNPLPEPFPTSLLNKSHPSPPQQRSSLLAPVGRTWPTASTAAAIGSAAPTNAPTGPSPNQFRRAALTTAAFASQTRPVDRGS